MKAKVAVVVDNVSSLVYHYNWEKEVDGILEDMRETLEISLELVAKGNDIHSVKGKRLDVLVVDYGGLSTVGEYDEMYRQIRETCRWAENHQSVLVIIYTTYTWHFYKREFADSFGHVGNIKFWYADDDNAEIKSWLVGYDKIELETLPILKIPGRRKRYTEKV